MRQILAMRGTVRIALMTLMAVWLMSGIVGTVGESRTTWLLLGVIALSHRLAEEAPEELQAEFPNPLQVANLEMAGRLQ
jgi:hypothetical protein